MGFIKDNTNTLEVYLTDLGKEMFFKDGLKNAVAYFSICDGDQNYSYFNINPNTLPMYDQNKTYFYGDVVKHNFRSFGIKIFRCIVESTTGAFIGSNWEVLEIVFNPTVIDNQPIPVINHEGTKLTSLGNNIEGNFISDVFIQTPLRGSIADNIEYKRALFGTKHDTQRDYVMREPDINLTTTTSILTYIKV